MCHMDTVYHYYYSMLARTPVVNANSDLFQLLLIISSHLISYPSIIRHYQSPSTHPQPQPRLPSTPGSPKPQPQPQLHSPAHHSSHPSYSPPRPSPSTCPSQSPRSSPASRSPPLPPLRSVRPSDRALLLPLLLPLPGRQRRRVPGRRAELARQRYRLRRRLLRLGGDRDG